MAARFVDKNSNEYLNNIPDILYKYRDWNNDFHKKLLFEKQLYFASADQFNDPYDCSMPYKWKKSDLTEANIFTKYYNSLKSDRPDLSETQIHEICYNEQKQGLFHDEEHIKKVTERWRELEFKRYGIVSLTPICDNFLMWSHYSNSHTGFAIGFDKFILIESTKSEIGQVIYQNEIPEFGIFEDLIEKSIKQMYIKSSIWEYEYEFRLRSILLCRKSVTLAVEAIKEIILGCNMKQKDKFEIIDKCAKMYPNAELFEMQLDRDTFKLNKFRIR